MHSYKRLFMAALFEVGSNVVLSGITGLVVRWIEGLVVYLNRLELVSLALENP